MLDLDGSLRYLRGPTVSPIGKGLCDGHISVGSVGAKPARIHRKASSLRYLYMRKKGGELADTLAKNLNELGNVGGT